jgi:hypothetical protein
MPHHWLVYMGSSETHSKDTHEIDKDEAVLPQIGEDPGLTAETIEQDSKPSDQGRNKKGKSDNRARTEQ